MNKMVTSKEEILKISREIVISEGLSSINMRKVAKECNIAVGSLYNYFPSKKDLISSVVRNIWMDIFHLSEYKTDLHSFLDAINWIYESLENGNKKYNDFLIQHSSIFLSDDKKHGKEMMDNSLKHIKDSLKFIVLEDKSIDKDIFNESFSIDDYIDFIFTNILFTVVNKNNSIDFLIEIIKRTIY